MITDLFYLSIIVVVFFLGFNRPHIALAGLVWVNLFKPQAMSYSFLAGKPLSAVMTAFALLVFALNFKKLTKPSSGWYLFLVPFFSLWITLTTMQAEFQHAAWVKFDVAIKTILVSFLIPFVLQKKKHIELFLWVLIGSLSFYFITAGVKSALGYGGYGTDLVSLGDKALLSEGSTLSTYAIASIPIIVYLSRSSLANLKIWKFICFGLVLCCLFILIGTQARTGLVVLVVLLVLTFKYTPFKKEVFAATLLAPILAIPFISDAWTERMSTISDTSNESSAHGRVLVWRWTIDYASVRPIFGGGFNAYLANAGELNDFTEEGEVSLVSQNPRGFHSVIFEVLGEHGYVGLIIYLAIICHALMMSYGVFKDELLDCWLRNAALAMFMAIVCCFVGGLFLELAFYPFLYQLYGVAVGLHKIARSS